MQQKNEVIMLLKDVNFQKQPIGSYWHLATRRTEHANMSTRGWEGRLKMAACAINERLQRDTMQCCIHGDAKEANMLFIHKDGKKKKCGGGRNSDGGGGITVGMYDYQYCGKAPPTVDLAYYFCVSTSVQTTNYYRQYMHEVKHPLSSATTRTTNVGGTRGIIRIGIS